MKVWLFQGMAGKQSGSSPASPPFFRLVVCFINRGREAA
nr:MAG TPA: hypothetical protein [Caudoviricetes sp.]